MADVFISYARADRDRVRLIAHGLTAEGFAVWWDPEIKPGRKWNDVIRKALSEAAAVVTVWTPASCRSHWVAAETTAASNRNALVPVTLKACQPPIPFNMVQSADLTRWRGGADDPQWMDVLRQVRALVEAKRRIVAAAPPPGEAHAADFRGQTAAHARYQPSMTRGRMGPRMGQLLLGGAVAGVVITAGLWASENAYTPPAPAPPTITEAALDPPAPAAPGPEPVALETPPAEAPPLDPAPAPQEPAADAPGDDPRAVRTLDACAQRLLTLCPGARDRRAEGFASDRALAPPEQRFLRDQGLSFAPATMDAAIACRDAFARAQQEPSNRLAFACRSVAWISEPAPDPQPASDPPPAPPAADPAPAVDLTAVVEAIRNMFARRDPAPKPDPPADAAPVIH